MKGDFTRDTFDRAQHFSRVLMQQGRVQLDADWNEQTSILLHYVRTLAADILGAHAGPRDALGFELITNGTVEQWERAGLDPETEWKRIEPGEDRRRFLMKSVKAEDAVIGAGRYYVQGVMVENDRPILYTEQLGYPFTPEMVLNEELRNQELLVYLDVWERHITYVQNEHIREVALGGADTCTRAQVVWQVKVLIRDLNEDTIFGCKSVDQLVRTDLPKLSARARRGEPSPELCSVSPESQYRGLENHLYRVEVHEGKGTIDLDMDGETSAATFKWSRDNGSVVFPIVSLTGTTAVVETLGRDPCDLLQPGDWVEVCDDVLALREQSGPLARVEAVDRDELKVTLNFPNGVTQMPAYTEVERDKHPLLRRWDHAGNLAEYKGALPVTEDWVELEDGVQIQFSEDGSYRVGDYWLIPARVATGDVEWPREPDGHGPAALPPHGPQHYYAPLYHANPDEDGMKPCRCEIKSVRVCPNEEDDR